MYLRRGYAPLLPAVHPDSLAAAFGAALHRQEDQLLRRSFGRGFFDPYVKAQYFPVKESELSAFCSDNGWSRLAILYGLEALRLSTVPCPEVFMNISTYYEETGDRERAILCRTRAFE